MAGLEALCLKLWVQPSVQPTQGLFLGGEGVGSCCISACLPQNGQKVSLEGEITAWKTLYRPLLQKRSGDLYWRILRRAVSIARFLNRVDPGISQNCAFCGQEETVENLFIDCFYCFSFDSIYCSN